MIGDDKIAVITDKAPPAVGPYSQAIRAGDYFFCSGMIPLDPKTGQVVGSDAAAQTEKTLQNLSALLEVAGSGLFQIVKTTVFLRNLGDFDAMNAVYAKYFPVTPPARSTVEVSRLPKDVLVEIEAVVYQPRRDVGGATRNF